ncbi:MAG: NUDIX domain-containing protein [Candidatus Manganitrophus sp.]|nr:MAG: NUDIX domain-containing protein [Candidatus Manganitrophus sp.]
MKFCPECGRPLVQHKVERHLRQVCLPDGEGCGFIDYGRFTLGVGGLVIDADPQTGERRVLLIQRNQEPNKGGWTLPGGFVDFDETVDQAAVREVMEETGLQCRAIGMVGFRNRADSDVNTSYAVFLLEAIGGERFTQPTEEIAQCGFYTLSQIQEMPRLAPLSRTVATAALTAELHLLRPITVPGLGDRPPFTFFIGSDRSTQS